MASVSSLRTARDFRRVHRSGARARSDGLTVIAAPSPAAGSRLGISMRAGRTIAVERNRVRRRLKEAWRALELEREVDVVVQADAEATELPFQKLTEHLAAACDRACARLESQ